MDSAGRPSLSRFRGCLLAALAGDCLGEKAFDLQHIELSSKLQQLRSGDFQTEVQKHFLKESATSISQDAQRIVSQLKVLPCVKPDSENDTLHKYTDDTAMTLALSRSLMACSGFDPQHLAKEFVETYFGDPNNRHYGGTIPVVFKKLKESNYSDPFGPAAEQFSGRGSFGNGTAMRVAPVALFHARSLSKTIEVAKKQCLVTHTHPNGIMGGIIQAVAVFLALNWPSKHTLDVEEFIQKLQECCTEESSILYGPENRNRYFEKLKLFPQLCKDAVHSNKIEKILGNGIPAVDSVPAAIFSFLRCLMPATDNEVKNPLLRTLIYAVSIGGDMDTIGTMAGAIAGAYYGDDHLPKIWARTLEKYSDTKANADWFHEKNFQELDTVDY